jgi:hypothetical protein
VLGRVCAFWTHCIQSGLHFGAAALNYARVARHFINDSLEIQSPLP